MSNHVQLLFERQGDAIGRIMHRRLTGYSEYYNRRYRKRLTFIRPLFDNRQQRVARQSQHADRHPEPRSTNAVGGTKEHRVSGKPEHHRTREIYRRRPTGDGPFPAGRRSIVRLLSWRRPRTWWGLETTVPQPFIVAPMIVMLVLEQSDQVMKLERLVAACIGPAAERRRS